MKLTDEIVDSLLKSVQDSLSIYQEKRDFDIISIESTINDLSDGKLQEIEAKIKYRPSGESDTRTTTYYKSVYENSISELKTVIFDDIMNIVCPED